MKYVLVYTVVIFGFFTSFSQQLAKESVFSDKEFLEFKIKYLSFNTSTATLTTSKTLWKDKPVYHIKGEGKSSKFLSLFFKIRDRYETYIDTSSYLPYRFVRNIYEGGYTKDILIDFDQETQKATVNNRKHKTVKTFDTSLQIHDMVSAFYYLRNTIDINTLEKGEEKQLTMFFDEQNYKFKLKYLGDEIIRTKFGKINCMRFRPSVMADRVFKEEESLSVWISKDQNLIPVQISADLAVGALTAVLNSYEGLKYPLLKVN